MSRIHHREVSLDDLLTRFHVAVVARVAQPPEREEAIEIGAPHPDFVNRLTRLEVLECLTPGGPAAGTLIEVESADASGRLRMHLEYYQRGVMRSPIFERFEGAALAPGVTLIALLDATAARLAGVSARYAWIADFSCVPLSDRKTVERARPRR